MAYKYTTINNQLALFTKDFFKEAQDLPKIFDKIIKEIDFFDKEACSFIPLPSSAPREIPRMIFKGEDNNKGITVNISYDKFDIYWNEKPGDSIENKLKIESIINLFNNLTACFDEKLLFKRVGLIKRFFVDYKDGEDIFEKIIKSAKYNDLYAYSIKLTFNEDLDKNHQISIDKVKVGNKEDNLTDAMQIASDFNTKKETEDSNRFDNNDINDFIKDNFNKNEENSVVSKITNTK
jgi:hypothetical protein